MMRGINRQRIFEDTEDHYTFLQCLSDGLQRLDKEQRNAILSGISFQIFQKLFWTSRDSDLSLCPREVRPYVGWGCA